MIGNNLLNDKKLKFLNQNSIKHQKIRDIIPNKTDTNLFIEQSESFYIHKILPKISNVKDPNKYSALKNNIIEFNKVCNVIMRKNTDQSLLFQDLLTCIDNIAKELKLTNEEREHFLIATIFINFHHKSSNPLLKLTLHASYFLYLLFIVIIHLSYEPNFNIDIKITIGIFVSLVVLLIYRMMLIYHEKSDKNKFTKSFISTMKYIYPLTNINKEIGNCNNIITKAENLDHKKFLEFINKSLEIYNIDINNFSSEENIKETTLFIKEIIDIFKLNEEPHKTSNFIEFNDGNINLQFSDPINYISILDEDYNNYNWIIIKRPGIKTNPKKSFFGFHCVTDEILNYLSSVLPMMKLTFNNEDIFSVKDFFYRYIKKNS